MTPSPSNASLAGQRLMVGFDGFELDDDLKYLIREIGINGIILFKRNIESPQQVRELTHSAQNYALACGQNPLFIAVDQEGGDVARFRGPLFTEFPGNPHIQVDADARHFAEVTAAELSAMGINMNMAPVLDVVPVGTPGIMARRSFGDDPSRVSRLGRIVAVHLQQNGILSVAKHFPGMGRALQDPHIDPTGIDISLAEMEGCDLIPFCDAIADGVSGIMLSHLVYAKIDPDWPASLSLKIAHNLLQKKLGYTGLILTDDFDMGAIETHYPVEVLAQKTLVAHIDVALICHRTEKIEKFFDALRAAFDSSPKARQGGIVSYRKLTEIKRSFIRSEASGG